MSQHGLMTTQRNEVLGVLVKAGLDPNEFQWVTVESQTMSAPLPPMVDALAHTGSNWFFKFDWTHGIDERLSVFEPGADRVHNVARAVDWKMQLLHVRLWCESLRRELDAPDLWATSRSLVFPDLSGPEENSPFSEVEIKQIGTALDDVATRIEASGQVPAPELSKILAELQALREASTRVGRKDWKTMLLGALVGLVVSKGVDPDTMRVVWGHVVGAFGHVVRFLPG